MVTASELALVALDARIQYTLANNQRLEESGGPKINLSLYGFPCIQVCNRLEPRFPSFWLSPRARSHTLRPSIRGGNLVIQPRQRLGCGELLPGGFTS